jgi:hypothetical protein
MAGPDDTSTSGNSAGLRIPQSYKRFARALAIPQVVTKSVIVETNGWEDDTLPSCARKTRS